MGINYEKRIKRIKHIRDFGEEIGLQFNGSFRKVDLSKSTPYWYVYASYPDRIEAVLGNKNGPCEEYNNKKKASKCYCELKQQGMHVKMYSFDAVADENCPITKKMLDEKINRQAEVIMHEGFHFLVQNLNIYMPLHLEEAIATYVGVRCSQVYFQEYEPRFLPCVEKQEQNWLHYSKLMIKWYNQLNAFYENPTGPLDTQLKKINAEVAKERSKGQLKTTKPTMNNANFIRNRDYFLYTPAVWTFFDKNEALWINIFTRTKEVITIAKEHILKEEK